MKRFKGVFDIDSTMLIKVSIILITLFILEYLVWNQMNYYHRPNEIAMGNFVAGMIFLASCILIPYCIYKGYDKWAFLLLLHLLMLFFIDRITLNQGWKRHLDTIDETWGFQFDESNYMLKRDKGSSVFTLYLEDTAKLTRGGFDPILDGTYMKTENGWKFTNEPTNITYIGKELKEFSNIKVLFIKDDVLIGFPTIVDSLVIKKIYF